MVSPFHMPELTYIIIDTPNVDDQRTITMVFTYGNHLAKNKRRQRRDATSTLPPLHQWIVVMGKLKHEIELFILRNRIDRMQHILQKKIKQNAFIKHGHFVHSLSVFIREETQLHLQHIQQIVGVSPLLP